MLRLLVSVIAVALIQGLTAIGLLLQWAPVFVRLLWRISLSFLALSCVGYRGLLTWIATRWGGWFLIRQPWRTVAAIVLSNLIGTTLCFALMGQVTIQMVVAASIHGLVVGMAWDQLGLPNGQSLGR